MLNRRSITLCLLSLICSANTFHTASFYESDTLKKFAQKSASVLLKSDDAASSAREDDIVAESSTRILSKYETRSKLLEAALKSSRVLQAQSDSITASLRSQVSNLSNKLAFTEENDRQIIAALEKSKNEFKLAIVTLSEDLNRIEKLRQQESNLGAAEIDKYKNRLILLESAYRETKAALAEKEEEANVGNELYTIEKNLVTELRFEIDDLKEELDRTNMKHLVEEKVVMAERDRLEKVIADRSKLDLIRKEELKLLDEKNSENERILREENKSKTFQEFMRNNLESEKLSEWQTNQKREQELFLRKQESFLEEAKRIVYSSIENAEVKSNNQNSLQEISKSISSIISAEMTPQSRLLKRQADLLQSLISSIDLLEATVTSNAEVISKGPLANIENISASSAAKVETDNFDNDRMQYQRSDSNEDLKERIAVTELGREKSPRSDKEDDIKYTSRIKVEYIEDDAVEGDLGEENPVSALFGKIVKNLSTGIMEDDEGDYRNKKIEGNEDNYINYNDGVQKKQVTVVKPGSAQKKRVKFARTSGRLLRNIGGALAKSATDTLGFWVGLGFDELEVVENGDVRARRADVVPSQAPKQINSDIVIDSTEIILVDDISNTDTFSWKGEKKEPVRVVRALNPSGTYSENGTAFAATPVEVTGSADSVSTQDSTEQTDLTETNWEKALIMERRKKEEEKIDTEMVEERRKEIEKEEIEMAERQREEEEYDLLMEKQLEQQERETEEALGKTLDYDRVQVINDDSSVYNELD